jgi:hypothetical protein
VIWPGGHTRPASISTSNTCRTSAANDRSAMMLAAMPRVPGPAMASLSRPGSSAVRQ